MERRSTLLAMDDDKSSYSTDIKIYGKGHKLPGSAPKSKNKNSNVPSQILVEENEEMIYNHII